MPSPGVGADGRGGAEGQPAFQRAEAILESIGDEFIAFDREWRYLYANERALHQIRRASGLALEAADLLGRNCWELFPQLAGTAFDVELHRALRDQQVVEFEARSPTTGRWVDIRAFPSATGLSLYTRDISARRAAQEEMLKRSEQQALVAELGRRALAGGGLQLLLDETVRQVATATLPPAVDAVPELVPFDAQSRKALELTYREALRMGHNYIGTEHILLALLEVEDGTGVLAGLGVDKARAEAVITAAVAACAAAADKG